ncbi:MAG: TniQ family protein [Microbacterium sp.]
MGDVRPLGARLTFIENEWLPSMFRRIGHEFGSSADDITDWCGLYDIPLLTRRRLANRLTAVASHGIETGLGLTTAQLRTTVMSHLPPDLVSLRENGTPIPSKDWSRGSGTRYCAECLREHPGVFYTQWRLWWSFICERHHTLLRGGCPACHQDIVEADIHEREARDPKLCWATSPDGDYCRHPLADAWNEPVIDIDSPMLQAQLVLARGWARLSVDLPSVAPKTLRGAGIALLGAGDLNVIAELARVPLVEIRGLFDQRDRTGGTPPREPLAMSALLGAAYRLITDPEPDVRAIIRETTFIRPVKSVEAVEGPGSARYLLSFWPGIDKQMHGRVLRALDPDLPPIQRLVHGSAASSEAFETFRILQERARPDYELPLAELEEAWNSPTRETDLRWAERMIPRLMWPSWAAPLGVDDHTDPVALQTALADALRIAGSGDHPDPDAIAGIGRRLRPRMLGNTEQTTTILRQICELALVLRSQPGPIDYERRIGIPTDQLLLERHWQALTASVGDRPGKQRRLIHARRYAFLRMSGAGPVDLPVPLRFRSPGSDAGEYTEFVVTMSAELKIAIDQYLIAWIGRFEHLSTSGYPRLAGARIVVAHEPPRFRHPGARLAPELDDIDLPALHELIDRGTVRLGVLAEAVGRTPRHVRWALAAHPVPSGRLVSEIDWERELAQLPDRSRPAPTSETPRIPRSSWADSWSADLRRPASGNDIVAAAASEFATATPRRPRDAGALA